MSGSHQLSYYPEATAEADEALAWYLERSPLAASAFLQELDHATARIIEAPHRWPRFRKTYRRYLLPTFPFSVIYAVRAGRIEVMAIAHHRRRPGDWKVRAT